MGLDNFINELRQAVSRLRPHDYIDLEIPNCQSWISHRPSYCDRGRFQWMVESTDPRELTIDAQDCFPRMYFQEESLIREVEAWLNARKLTGVSVCLHSHTEVAAQE